MKGIKKLLGLVLSFALIFAMFITPMTTFAADLGDLTGKVVVLHTNDTHARVAADDYNGQFGFARVATLKKQYEAAGATVVLLDAGDVLHGLPIANLSKGENIIKVLNQVGYDAFVPGNHDFNYGTKRLLELAGKDTTSYTGETFNGKVLSANYATKDAPPVNPLDAYTIIERGGKKVGIFGLSTVETLTKSHPDNTKGYQFLDIVETAKAQITALKAENCDYIIALTHLGLDDGSGNNTSKYLAEQVTGLDLIVDGHSHSKLTSGLDVNGTKIVSAGDYITSVGVVVMDGTAINASLTSFDKTTPANNPAQDTDTLALVEQLVQDTNVALDVKVGETTVNLDGERNDVRTGETNLGNFATDAMRYYGDAQLAFTNGGGIRASIKKGDIKKKDLVTVFPFGNYVVTKKVTVETVIAMLELGVKDYPTASGGFPQVSGLSFTFDYTRPVGSKVTSLTIGNEVVYRNGTYLALPAGAKDSTYKTKTYSLATNDFTAAGGDDYKMLGNSPEIGQFGGLEEALIDYLATNPNMDDYAMEEGRIKADYIKEILSYEIKDGKMIITFTDGSKLDMGKVVGNNGTNGTNGTNGIKGPNGKDANPALLALAIIASLVAVGISIVPLVKKKS